MNRLIILLFSVETATIILCHIITYINTNNIQTNNSYIVDQSRGWFCVTVRRSRQPIAQKCHEIWYLHTSRLYRRRPPGYAAKGI